MDRLAHYGMTKAGLAEALSAATTSHDALSAETYGPVINALTMLLAANEKAGTVRSGLDPDDVLLILGFLWRIDPASDWRAQAGRLLDILMDGLRAGAPSPSNVRGSDELRDEADALASPGCLPPPPSS
jgi:hypothetical protein